MPDGAPHPVAAIWKHLRLPFQMSLAPIFLWGALLAPHHNIWRLAALFFAFHFCLYTGLTAYNTAFDRDTGPIGGLLAPPPAPAALMPVSLALLAIGLALAMKVGLECGGVYAAIAAIGIGYSHPRTRFKRRPVASAAAVFIGQGALGFTGGWSTGASLLAQSWPFWPGLLAAALITLGLYPATQAYQIEEDRARGDRTISVWLGPLRALVLGAVCVLLGGVCGAGALWPARPMAASLLVGGSATSALLLARYGRQLDRGALTTPIAFRHAMAISFCSSGAFALLIAAIAAGLR